MQGLGSLFVDLISPSSDNQIRCIISSGLVITIGDGKISTTST